MAVRIEAFRDLLSPALRGELSAKGDGVVSASIQIDHATDALFLCVTHILASRFEIEDDVYKRLFRPRVRRALLCDPDPAKHLRADRRRFLARAEAARTAKQRPRKPLEKTAAA